MRNWVPKEVPNNPGVTMIVPSYQIGGDRPRRRAALHCLIYSLLAQTYTNWKAVFVHDGPLEGNDWFFELEKLDPRLTMLATKERTELFGQPIKHPYACLCNTEFVCFSNDDNYYIPVYFEWMLHTLLNAEGGAADLVHCDILHSHWIWKEFKTSALKHHCDSGSFIVRTEKVRKTPWKNLGFEGDGEFVEDLSKICKTVHLEEILFIHN